MELLRTVDAEDEQQANIALNLTDLQACIDYQKSVIVHRVRDEAISFLFEEG